MKSPDWFGAFLWVITGETASPLSQASQLPHLNQPGILAALLGMILGFARHRAVVGVATAF
ncbi:MAG: hypothetical protein ACK418_18355, partial [Pseudomonas sp.]|uniref:hypothetical protein n=1 Tax=Pseudomonas sp. TaxID=306 RepID=UPI0039195901